MPPAAPAAVTTAPTAGATEPAPAVPRAEPGAPPRDDDPGPAPVQRPTGRWAPVPWASLPGWGEDRLAEAWPAVAAGCARPAADWAAWCARALASPPPADPTGTAAWWMAQLQPWRIEAADGNPTGLATGYFEPLLEASRRPRAGFRVAIHAPPPELATRRPFWTREQLDTLPAAAATLRGLELAWLADPMDLLVLQIQGSGRVRITEPDGRVNLVRMAFAAHNDQPYRSVGRWLIERGELAEGSATWPAIRAWADANPREVPRMLHANPRVVFFREEPIADPTIGPRGAAGVPLVAGRSIAVDPRSVPYGTPVWLDTTEPLSATPLRRLVMAQDTGSAIVGAVRADYFWGTGAAAEAQAGRMRQPLRMWALWPRGLTPPGVPAGVPTGPPPGAPPGMPATSAR